VVNTNHNVDRAKTEATSKEYLDNMQGHIARANHNLDLNKMLGAKKVQLDWKERNLHLREAALVEVQS
jgi:TnpA family transposase